MNRLSIITLDESVISLQHTRMLHAVRMRVAPILQGRTALHGFRLFYITGGAMVVREGGTDVELGPGSIAFYPSRSDGTMHAKGRVSFYHCHFKFLNTLRTEVVDSPDRWMQIVRPRSQKARQQAVRSFYLPDQMRVIHRDRAAELLSAMMRVQDSRSPGCALAAKAYLLLLLNAVSSQVLYSLSGQLPPESDAPSNMHVRRVIGMIEMRLPEPTSASDIAASLQLSPRYLNRLFRKQTSRGIGEYIRDRRLALAREQLVCSEMSIKQIAAWVGFQDALYFSRVFRRHVGVSPRHYRALSS